MNYYFLKNPKFISWLYPKATWNLSVEKKEIYLTFDDGPHPVVTTYVLELLNKYKAKATFFCVGKNLAQHSDIAQAIISEGHDLGNHTQDHTSGWSTPTPAFIDSVKACEEHIAKIGASQKLFRPPYGRLKSSQSRILKEQGYQIIMWSHLSGDFDPDLMCSKSLASLKSATPGSILVFHDSEKALNHLKKLLEDVLIHFTTLGYTFKKISQYAH